MIRRCSSTELTISDTEKTKRVMTQDERRLHNYNEVKDFIIKNKRNPSQNSIEDHLLLNFIKHNRKLLNKG